MDFFLDLLVIFLFGGFIVYAFSMMYSDILGAPYVPIPKKAIRPILDGGDIKHNDIFIDLGSGDGRVLRVATQFTKSVTGYERSLWPYLKSKIFNHSVAVYRKNFFKISLQDATYIYAYLYPELIEKVAQKISIECGPGTRLLIPRFRINHRSYKLMKEYVVQKIPIFLYQIIPKDS